MKLALLFTYITSHRSQKRCQQIVTSTSKLPVNFIAYVDDFLVVSYNLTTYIEYNNKNSLTTMPYQQQIRIFC